MPWTSYANGISGAELQEPQFKGVTLEHGCTISDEGSQRHYEEDVS